MTKFYPIFVAFVISLCLPAFGKGSGNLTPSISVRNVPKNSEVFRGPSSLVVTHVQRETLSWRGPRIAVPRFEWGDEKAFVIGVRVD